MATQPAPTEAAPPYTSFTTLMNTIERMQEEGGVPNRVDRSYLSNMPGSVRATFITSMKSLGLIGDDLRPTDTLVQLVEAEESGRKTIVHDLVHERYPEALTLGKMATQSQLEEVFRSYGVSGSTLRKAVGFFLSAARYGEIPLSPHFKLPRADTGASRTARRREAVSQPPAATPSPAPDRPEHGRTHHPLIDGLFHELPPVEAGFSPEEQAQWLELAKVALRVVYKTPDRTTPEFRPGAHGGESG